MAEAHAKALSLILHYAGNFNRALIFANDKFDHAENDMDYSFWESVCNHITEAAGGTYEWNPLA